MLREKIPATVITGFLGSGKTTLLAHLLKNSGGQRIAVLINEFGSLGMDEAIVQNQCDDACKPQEIIELANGCICCTVADDFLPAMQKILDNADSEAKPIDHIIIETSGLALPKPLLKAFQWHDIAPRVTVNGVVAVVDGPAILSGRFQDVPAANREKPVPAPEHDNELAELFEDQLLCADIVLLNKCDIMSAAERKKIIEDMRSGKIEGLRPAAKIIETTHGVVDPRVVLGMGQAVEMDLDNRKSHHDDEEEHGHDEFATFIVTFGEVEDEKKLEKIIQQLLQDHDILRMKGLITRRGKPRQEIWQVAGPRIEHYFQQGIKNNDGPPKESQLVVIGLKGLDEKTITQALQSAA